MPHRHHDRIFLGSWRSTLIIAVSIPRSILSSVIVLSLLHETINIMTLGGLALAVGILVNDATVTIENIERFLEEGYNLHDAILEGAGQTAVPALVSTICICIVYLPMFSLAGVAALAMIIGMVPMALGMGEGGEQNAPLGRAVIGGLICATVATLAFVPTVFRLLHTNRSAATLPGEVAGDREPART